MVESSSGFNIKPDDLHSAGRDQHKFSESVDKNGKNIGGTLGGLKRSVGRDRSGVGSIISNALGSAGKTIDDVTKQLTRVMRRSGDNLQHSARDHRHNEERTRKSFEDIHPDGGTKSIPRPGGGSGRGGGPQKPGGKDSGPHSGSGGGAPNQSIGGSNNPPSAHSKPNGGTPATADPIDLTTGRVLLDQVDVQLPGTLPLYVSRSHRSDFRHGRWFGANWSSVFDQKIEVAEDAVHFAAADGMLLSYPMPAPGAETSPVHGTPWPLSRGEDGGYLITASERGEILHFAPATAGQAPLIAITNRNGDRIDLGYDSDGTITEMRHSGGYHVDVETSDGLVTALRLRTADDQSIELVSYTYQDRRLTGVVTSSGIPMRFEYDSSGRLLRWIDRNGMWYRYRYDSEGRCVEASGRDGYLNCTLDYDLDNRVIRHTNSLGHATAHHLNEEFQVVRVVDPLGNAIVSTWDEQHRLLSRTDPLGNTTRYTYDELGNLVTLTYPDGAQTLAEYDEHANPTTIVDPDGAVWRRTYNERGNLASVTDPTGARTTYRHDPAARVASVVDVAGNTSSTAYDAAGLPVVVTDPIGAVARTEYDAFGRASAVTDPAGGVTRTAWTVEGRPLRKVRPDGSLLRWTYDSEGNVRDRVDENGHRTTAEVGPLDVPTLVTGPQGVPLRCSYDTELQLVAVTNPQGLSWRYIYDPAGRLIRETDFNGRVLSYRHDAAGQVIATTNGAGQTVEFTRDARGQVVRAVADDGAVTAIDYDPAGRPLTIRNRDAELRYTYDPLGRILTETVNGREIRSTYNRLGQRVSRTTPTGAASHWEYDPAGRPVTLHTAGRTLHFDRDALGREVRRRLDTTAALTQEWDAVHRLRSQTLVGPDRAGTVHQRTYSYRRDDTLTAIEDLTFGREEFALDPVGRVTEVRGPNGTQRYAYDAGGNTSHAAWPGTLGADESNGDRQHRGSLLTQAGAVRYEHDAQGRMVLRQELQRSGGSGVWRYQWDAEDHLAGVHTPDGGQWRYRYDPLGRRIAKEHLDSAGRVLARTDFTWDGDEVIEQVDHTGRATVWDWEPGSTRVVSQTERAPLREGADRWVDKRCYAVITDPIGTPTELVDPDGSFAWRGRSTLWGLPTTPQQGQDTTPLRFPGQYFDTETGLHYNHHRYYDPQTGHYLSPDPLGLPAGPNPHIYVPNPLQWTDPLGLNPNWLSASWLSGSLSNKRLEPGRIEGKPDTILSGHGGIRIGDTSMVKIPKGTWVHFYGPHGEGVLSNDKLLNIEQGRFNYGGGALETFGPGQKIPNYTLDHPQQLIQATSNNPNVQNVNVDKKTELSDLLRPNQGNVHWSACRNEVPAAS